MQAPQRRHFMLTALAGGATFGTLAALPARAQAAWPARPVRFVVPFPPGGGTDTTSRVLADRFNTVLKWTVVVENKPGAAGNIGMDAVAKAAPDGYTLGMGQASNLAINPALYGTMPFDPLKDFSFIASVAEQPVVLVVRQDSPYKTLADFLQAAKARPAGLTIAQAGSGTVGHLAGEMLARRAGVQVMQVPYKGAGPAMNDLLGGQVAGYFGNSVSVMTQLQAGKVRALCVSSAQRLPAMAQVPTVAEQGFAGFAATTWLGVVGPAGMPAELVDRINRETSQILARPDVLERLASEGSVPTPGTPQQFADMVRKEHGKWGALIREAGIKLD